MAPAPYESRKRRREPVNVDVKLVEIYEDLANENNEIRLKAAQELVSRFTPDKSPTDEQIEKVLKRLFRGLCSGRKAARIGFSIALTEILCQVFTPSRDSASLNVTNVLRIWESQSQLSEGNAAGQVRSSSSKTKDCFIYIIFLYGLDILTHYVFIRKRETIILVGCSEQRQLSSHLSYSNPTRHMNTGQNCSLWFSSWPRRNRGSEKNAAG